MVVKNGIDMKTLEQEPDVRKLAVEIAATKSLISLVRCKGLSPKAEPKAGMQDYVELTPRHGTLSWTRWSRCAPTRGRIPRSRSDPRR